MEAKLNAPVYDGYNLIYYLKQGQFNLTLLSLVICKPKSPS